MKYKLFISIFVSLFLFTQNVFAVSPKETAKYFNGPSIKNVSNSSAQIYLNESVLKDLSTEELSRLYFSYIETHKACIMIYPTPEECLPKKTKIGLTDIKIENLKPNTSYTVTYHLENSIVCVTTPCNGNEFSSLSSEFTTSQINVSSKNLFMGMYGTEVKKLQEILIAKKYLTGTATGYFGIKTKKALMNFQKENNIPATGVFGKLSRQLLFTNI